ncbi:FecR family protein [Chitinophaga sp. S165]|uniref:FecR family protein n=1 Tax=Chitinophaga sp. S165 TaxID=2135462 RepID=UPI000D712D72|nr:FecR family protein [Chitinophaga sp. S165]PWV47085.1 FecR family protein [Chitinophaga sp. S165]
MTTDKFQRLLESYLNGRISNRELARFLVALDQPEHQEQVLQYLDSKLQETTVPPDGEFVEKSYNRLVDLINNGMHDPGATLFISPVYRRIDRHLVRYAAILIGVALISVIWYWFAEKQPYDVPKQGRRTEVKYADTLKHAYLALADGTILILDSTAPQNDTFLKLGATLDYKNHRLSFGSALNKPRSSIGLLTLVTPRGGQFSVRLSDGSTVWLNALSRLQFPDLFQGQDRRVTFSGEGYFSVTEAASSTFRVEVGPVNVKVLGTEFNVQAYTTGTQMRTTLVRGKVEITGEKKQYTLFPGQALTVSGAKWKVSRADTSQVTAWKQQLFDFRKANLQTIMPELARWYDITYEIPPGIKKTFTGKIPRTADIFTVLLILKEGGIQYRQEGKKIVILQ